MRILNYEQSNGRLVVIVLGSQAELARLACGAVVRCGGLRWEIQDRLDMPQGGPDTAALLLMGDDVPSPGMVLRFMGDPMPADEFLATRGKLLQLARLARMIAAEEFLAGQPPSETAEKAPDDTVYELAQLCAYVRENLPSPHALVEAEEDQTQRIARAASFGGS